MTPSPELESLEHLLRRTHLRVTRPRLAVLGAVHARPHSDTDTVLRDVRVELGQVSHQAVYDVLRALTTAGLVRRIQPLGHVARYEARVADNHHHAVCRSCGVITDVDCAVGAAPCLTPTPVTTTDRGFVVDEAEVIYWGRCPSCVTTAARAEPLSPDTFPQPDPSLERTTS
ncbi:MAG: transcriptional repressor [Actinomycetota bacterium]|nr:transcriptional repressor [Actinomycetota bacterium]